MREEEDNRSHPSVFTETPFISCQSASSIKSRRDFSLCSVASFLSALMLTYWSEHTELRAHRPEACTTKPVQHTQGIFSLSGLTNPSTKIPLNGPTTAVINSVNQPRVSQTGYEHVHIEGAGFVAHDQSQTWTSLRSAERHTLQTHIRKVKHIIQTKINTV